MNEEIQRRIKERISELKGLISLLQNMTGKNGGYTAIPHMSKMSYLPSNSCSLYKPVHDEGCTSRAKPSLRAKVEIGSSLDMEKSKRRPVETTKSRVLLQICSSCKKIRDDQGIWTENKLIRNRHSEDAISHGLCHDCARKLYPDVFLK